MSKKDNIGVYWGKEALFFADVSDKNLSQSFHTPIQLPPEFDEDASVESTAGDEITQAIRSALTQHQITTPLLAFSIPTRDVIFRSFVIPYMQASEVKNVVEFESTKYIPFQLEDLHYTFHPINIIEKDQKNIRILFIAVKKDKLAKYLSVFEHTGIKLDVVEPAYMSLTRTLTHKKLISKNKVSAIIEIQKNEGTIIIVEQNIPQFVREFQLYPKSEDPAKLSQDILRARLFNESKISFDYYSRQHIGQNVEEVIALSNSGNAEVFQNLAEDYEIPTKTIIMSELLANPESTEIGSANAYGVCLRHTVLSSVKFNIPWKEGEEGVETVSSAPLDLKFLGSVAGACLLITLLVFNFTGRMIKTYRNKAAILKQQLGSHDTLEPENIKVMSSKVDKKLKTLEAIHIDSKISYFLKSIPEMLPAGTWLDNLDIQYDETTDREKNVHVQLKLSFTGSAYKEDVTQQFSLVNDMMGNFKNNEEFTNFFENINLDSVQTGQLGKYTVTNFKVSCN